MDSVETEGDTIDAAIEGALKLLGVGRDKITVDIIAEGRKGILGFGAQKARVRAELRKSPLEHKITAEPLPAAPIDNSAMTEKAQAALQEILNLMGVKATVTQSASANGEETILEIRADDSGLLIGRKGQTLSPAISRQPDRRRTLRGRRPAHRHRYRKISRTAAQNP